METKRKFDLYFVKDNRGQSTVEYILLLAVAISIVATVFQSDYFKSTFGEEGKFSQAYRSEIEYSYRHARKGRVPYTTPSYTSPNHDSYTGPEGRFFGAKDAYP